MVAVHVPYLSALQMSTISYNKMLCYANLRFTLFMDEMLHLVQYRIIKGCLHVMYTSPTLHKKRSYL